MNRTKHTEVRKVNGSYYQLIKHTPSLNKEWYHKCNKENCDLHSLCAAIPVDNRCYPPGEELSPGHRVTGIHPNGGTWREIGIHEGVTTEGELLSEINIGVMVAVATGKTYPAKLDGLLVQAGDLYAPYYPHRYLLGLLLAKARFTPEVNDIFISKGVLSPVIFADYLKARILDHSAIAEAIYS
jgi:hypothetical protein